MDDIMVNLSESTKFRFTCRRGCSFCCHVEVETSNIEVRSILQFCKKKSITIDKEYLKRQSKAKNLHRSEVSACVFLKGNECSIYEARPLVCKMMYVVTDPKYCDTKTQSNNQVGYYKDQDMLALYYAWCEVARVVNLQEHLLKLLK
ncbi:MAG TPA: YkgJ family cysteine cluster protein [Anaerovoracaceae bacterium]|nr:YkgJ family cysteine cluster protein [Anaerovoracaceae bacterium]